MYKNSVKFGISTAIISFIIGSLFLISYLIIRDLDIAVFGYVYLIFAFIINLIIAFSLFVKAFLQKENRKKYFKTILIMLLNIPVAYIYFLIADQFI